MSVIVPLHLPKANLKITKKGEELFVWCVIRKKQLVLTPEEWVRQHVIHYFVNDLGIAQGRIVSEYTIRLNEMIRRCDIVVLDDYGLPKAVVECKAPDVALNENVFHQIAHYNRELKVDYLMMTNGVQHAYGKVNHTDGSLSYLPDFAGLGL